MDKLRKEYQDKLSKAKAPINKDALWEKIASDGQFPVKKNNPRRKLWLLSFAVLGLLFLGLLFINKNITTALTQVENVNNSSVLSKNAEQEAATKLASQEVSIGEAVLEIQKQYNNQDIVTSQNRTTTQNQIIRSRETQDTKNELIKNNPPMLSEYKSKVKQEVENNDGQIEGKSLSSMSPPNSTQEIKADLPVFNATKSTADIRAKEMVSDLEITALETFKSTQKVSPHTNSKPTIFDDANTAASNSRMADRSYFELPLAINSLSPSLSYINKQDLGSKSITLVNNGPAKWSFGLAVGIGYHLNNIKIDPTVDPPLSDNSLGFLRSQNTSSLETYKLQAELHREIRSNWHLGIGVQWTKMFEEYIYQDSMITYIRNEPSDDKFFSATRTLDTYHNFHTFQQIDLRLNLKRVWDFDKLSIAINTGVIYNLSFGATGMVTDASLQEESITSGRIYKTRLGLRSYAGVELIKPMLSGETFFSLQLEQSSNLSLSTSSLQHSVLPMYAMLGYRMRF